MAAVAAVAVVNLVAVHVPIVTGDKGVAGVALGDGDTRVVDAAEVASELAEAGVADVG